MTTNALIVLMSIVGLMAIASIIFCCALADKLNELNERVVDNRLSINRHTNRMFGLDGHIGRIDHTINDVYQRIDETDSLVRRYFAEAEEHENSESK